MLRELFALGMAVTGEVSRQIRRQKKRLTLAVDILTLRAGYETLITSRKLDLRQSTDRLASLMTKQEKRGRKLEQTGKLKAISAIRQAEYDGCQQQIEDLRQQVKTLIVSVETTVVERDALLTEIQLADLEDDLAELSTDATTEDPRLRELREQHAQIKEILRRSALRDD